MTNGDETWLSTAQAAQALRLSQRQVLRYVESGQLRSRKAGRRVLIAAASVAKLADELAVDIPHSGPPARRSELPEPIVRALVEQRESAQRVEERLQRIEEQVNKPAPLLIPQWAVIGGAVAIALLVLILILLLVR